MSDADEPGSSDLPLPRTSCFSRSSERGKINTYHISIAFIDNSVLGNQAMPLLSGSNVVMSTVWNQLSQQNNGCRP
jgi:hypothetical protein